ncbi:hypothetical protein Glo7428_1974 [Gloeocapsa sp. PCC 7428]|uniref:DUF433 domain-containing protein n=1 Tax=Gloeocapsa sp. PCC 7428 TaxID=1173026 RepID=UPI0002A5DCB0|nr:hypothetical protein [Gloeocapsa sp. PCC 7428]AFZ30521.1 hypothetical protein Glo7428_1974 [Gloeocapsa sp. PCC 7428]
MTAVILSKQYVEQREAGYWLSGSRVSLDSIVYSFVRGELPEQIVQSFPTLTLEQGYGAFAQRMQSIIAFYLSNQEVIDAYLKQGEAQLHQLRQASSEENSQLYKKLASATKSR